MTYGPGNAGGAVTILGLSYGGQGPFDVPVFSLPIGWDGSGTASMGAHLTVGTNIASGLLLDMNSEALPDGFTFSAFIFVINTIIFDIVAVNAYAFGADGGVISWSGGGVDPISPTQISTLGGIGIVTSATTVNGISIVDNGSGGVNIQSGAGGIFISDIGDTGIELVANGTGPLALGATGVGSGVGIATTGGNATNGIEITTQNTDTGGIVVTDQSGVGIDLFSTRVVIGNHGTASGNDSVAIGDSGIAYSADQTVVAATNAQGMGLGVAQHSVVVAEVQSSTDGTNFLNTCIGATVLQLVDASNEAVWNRTIHIHAVCVARRIDAPGTDSAWQTDVVLRGDGSGSYSFIGGDPVFTVIAQDSAAADWSVGMQTDGSFVEAFVNGDNGMTINWEMTLTLNEVAG